MCFGEVFLEIALASAMHPSHEEVFAIENISIVVTDLFQYKRQAVGTAAACFDCGRYYHSVPFNGTFKLSWAY